MLRPKDVTDKLGISAPTLRLWSNNFSEVLSPGAQKSTTETGTAAQRRYTDQDVAIFKRAKQHLDSGKTYEETLQLLQSEPTPEAVEFPSTSPNTQTDVTPVFETHPIIQAFEQALKAKDETIASKDQALATKDDLIASLSVQIEQLKQQPIALPQVTPRFRWAILNKLLTVESQDVG